MRQNKKINALFLLTGILILTGLFFAPQVNAGTGLPFGGRVVAKVQCTCSVGSQVTIQGGRFSGTYLDSGSAKSYSNYFISPGRYVLGAYAPGGACLVTGTPCVTLPITKGTILRFGTSF